ncbi:hypothetical protein BD413DRAFT_12368 [Trametes elegans]|nr:hypothetical protein BD413DRAFT_12368 [Trametes elegans]
MDCGKSPANSYIGRQPRTGRAKRCCRDRDPAEDRIKPAKRRAQTESPIRRGSKGERQRVRQGVRMMALIGYVGRQRAHACKACERARMALRGGNA